MKEKNHILLIPALCEGEVDSLNNCLSQYLSSITREAKALPGGQLYIRYRNNMPNFCRYYNRKLNGITRKHELVHQIARRRFLLLQIPIIRQILQDGWTSSTQISLKKMLVEINELLTRYENAGLDIDQIVLTPNQQIWNSDRHSKKRNRSEELIYPTNGRIYMRSKSEQTIGNLLEALHIPYRYESRLRINNIDYHPDFIIMLPNDKLVILEHVGRMDLDEYNEGLLSRLQAYNSANLLIGRDVFLSFEHDTKDIKLILKIIANIMRSNPDDNRFLFYAAQNAGCNVKITSNHRNSSHRNASHRNVSARR